MRHGYYILFTLCLWITVACEKTGIGDIVSEKRNIQGINRLIIEDNIDVIFIRDSMDMLLIKAGEQLVGNIISEIKGDTLHVYNSNRFNWLKGYTYEVKAYMHFRNLDWVLYKGSGDIVSRDTLRLEKLWIGVMKSSGTVDLTIDMDFFSVSNSTGTADFQIKGQCERLKVRNDAYGFVDLSGLTAKNAQFYQNGTHLSKVRVTNKLEGAIDYSGDLLYYGNPPVVNVKIKDSGRLIKGNDGF